MFCLFYQFVVKDCLLCSWNRGGVGVCLVLFLVSDKETSYAPFFRSWFLFCQSPVVFADTTVSEQLVHPFQSFGCLGEDDNSAYRTVQTVGDTEEDSGWFGVSCSYESLEGLGQGLVICLVTLYYLPTPLVEDEQMVVFIEDSGGDVVVFLRGEFPVRSLISTARCHLGSHFALHL